MKKYFLLLVILVGCGTKKTPLPDFPHLPTNKEQLIISDYSLLFSQDQNNTLSKKIYQYELETTNQIVIVTVDSITPYNDIQKYASDIGNYWGIGQKEKDNGLIIVLCNKQRKIGIAAGYNTEKILTDSICKWVIDSTMVPKFANGNYYKGVSDGIDSLIVKWKIPSSPIIN